MLVYVIPSIYPSCDNSQLGIYVYEQCEALKEKGIDFVVLNSSSRGVKSWKYCGKIENYTDGVGEVYEKLTKGFAQSKLPRVAVYSYWRNLKKIFQMALKRYGKPDLIYAHFSFPAGYCARRLSKKYDIPYIVEEHFSIYLKEKIHKYIINITKKTIEDAKEFFCVSEGLRNSLKNHTNTDKDIDIVPNLINDRYTYHPVPRRDKFVFFSAGNLFESKKFDLLIDAFINTFTDEENVELRIGGNGPQYELLKNKIEISNRNHQIKLLGRLSSEQMLSEYINCNCFALLSEYETFGIVYREAMGVGRPVISAKNGGIEENWENSFGILVEKNDIDLATIAIKEMLENYNNYDCQKISEKCHLLYSSNTISEKILRKMTMALD